ncbi:MAG: Gfo/Idh/MocA family oxidoreductase [Pseudomonadota bacterium]
MTLRIGLLGASRIAPQAILTPAATMDDVVVTRVAASSPARAEQFAAEHGIADVERDYAALLRSDQVDLVYNALPPHAHLELTLAAVSAGKAVLCEKPFAMNAAQAVRMVHAGQSASQPVIEAFHYRFHPLMDRTLELLRSDTIGRPTQLEAHFNVPIPYRAGELRHTLELGGGALMDLGCYPVHWVRAVMGTEPRVHTAHAEQGQPGIDISMHATLHFDGVPATVSCSMDTRLAPGISARLHVMGTHGHLSIDNPIAPQSGHELRWQVRSGPTQTERVTGNSTYWHQLRHVKAVMDGTASAITGGQDAIANMAAIDAIYRAARMHPRGRTQELPAP